MDFQIRNLSVLSYANRFTLWHYKAGDIALDTVTTGRTFFRDAQDMLTEGDMIMVSANDGARVVVVASANELGVTVAPLS